jgi:hypothetical protein
VRRRLDCAFVSKELCSLKFWMVLFTVVLDTLLNSAIHRTGSPVSCIATIEACCLGESSLPQTMLVFEVFLLSMMVVLLLNDDDDPNEGYLAKLGNYPIVLKLTHRVCTSWTC